jgi:mannosyltransferase OCH1-like enzyme
MCRYGGIYLDSDVIILKPLTSLRNSIGATNHVSGNSRFGGAVLAFEKQR